MVIAIVVQALWRLGRSAVRTKWLAFVGASCLLLTLGGIHELIVSCDRGRRVARDPVERVYESRLFFFLTTSRLRKNSI